MASELMKSPGDEGLAKSNFAKKLAKKAPKKSAKKSAKKAAKKAAAKHIGPHHGRDDLRAYEHLGRIAAMRSFISEKSLLKVLDALIAFASEVDGAEGPKVRAEVLRAAEHVAFAALQHGARNPMRLHPRLKAEIDHHYANLRGKFDEHELDEPLDDLGQKLAVAAQTAFEEEHFSLALELIRAAEALHHTSH